LAGCPEGAASDNRVIRRRSYTPSYNGITKFVYWVAYVFTPADFSLRRQSVWRTNFNFPEPEIETLEPDDFKDIHNKIGVDRVY
jgi:DNA/RNA endonuclease G (NUC1)